jgi:hypothetical protein
MSISATNPKGSKSQRHDHCLIGIPRAQHNGSGMAAGASRQPTEIAIQGQQQSLFTYDSAPKHLV